jgi:hypothetical protein
MLMGDTAGGITARDIALHLELHAGKTNDIHPDHEQRVLRNLLSAAEREVASLELEILHAPAQSARDCLFECHQEELSRVERFRIALSPHKKLPPEILAAIFVSCVGTVVKLRASEIPTSWILSHVCSRWRQVAFGEHHLWNNVLVDFEGWADSFRLADMAKATLSRGGDSVIIHSDGESVSSRPRWDGLQNPMAYLVLPHVDRIKSLSLSAPDRWLRSGLGTYPLPFNVLETLELHFLHDQQMFQDVFVTVIREDSIAAFSAASGLRELTLRGDVWPFLALKKPLPPPWVQLTFLTLSHLCLPSYRVLDILDHCTNLVECVLIVRYGPPTPMNFMPLPPPSLHGPNIPEKTVLLSRLTRLRVSFDYDPKVFFPFLVLPALTHFELLSDGWPERAWPHEEFLSLMERSKCPLKWFFTLLDIPPTELAPLFESIPSLVRFMLPNQRSPFPDDVLRRISNWELLPHLRHIVAYVAEPNSFVDMLDRRWPAGTEASHHSLDYVSIFSGQTPANFEEIKERFINLSLARASKVPLMRLPVDRSTLIGFTLASKEYTGIII